MQWRVSTPGPRLPSYSWGDCVILAISPSWGLLLLTSPGLWIQVKPAVLPLPDIIHRGGNDTGPGSC